MVLVGELPVHFADDGGIGLEAEVLLQIDGAGLTNAYTLEEAFDGAPANGEWSLYGIVTAADGAQFTPTNSTSSGRPLARTNLGCGRV